MSDGSRPAGLRERKKARTKVAIQEAALRLFAERGYQATTVEQITEAAGVSRATFFRYFTGKADVVLYDVTDLLLVDALGNAPGDEHPVHALRTAIRSVAEQESVQHRTADRQREHLMRTVPELRAKVPEHLLAAIPLLAAAIARRHGRAADDLDARTVAGAIIGVAVATWTAVVDDLSEDFPAHYLALVDRALGKLEDGLSL